MGRIIPYFAYFWKDLEICLKDGNSANLDYFFIEASFPFDNIYRMLKKFLEWIRIKEKLHGNNSVPPLVNEGDLWWISIGENVGSEINGKSTLFTRPGLVLKKLSREFFLVAPTTSQKREGTWYVHIKQEGKDMYVCLHQIRTVDFRRLSSRMCQVDSDDFDRIKQAFLTLYK